MLDLQTVETKSVAQAITKTRSRSMITRITITKPLAEQIRRTKGYVVLERDGVPVAGTMDIDEFEDYLELQDPKVREQIRKSNDEYLAGKSRPAEELLQELRDAERKSTKRRPRK